MRLLIKVLFSFFISVAPTVAETCSYIGEFGSRNDRAKFYKTQSGLVTFIADMDVNTDGSQRSYHLTDLGYFDSRGNVNTRIGLNTICNGVSIRKPNGRLLYGIRNCGQLIKEFNRIRNFGWVQPGENFVSFFGIETQGLVRSNVLSERRKRKPCMKGDYFVSQIARQLPGVGTYGDCNPDKWLDAERIPAIVVPLTSELKSLGVELFDLAIVRLQNGNRVGAVVGDTNPRKVGEVTVNAAVRLTGKPTPKVYRDLFKLSIGNKVVEYIIFPGTAAKLGNLRNSDDAKIQRLAEDLFEANALNQSQPLCR